jgi:hypothetical protein
MHYLDIFSRAVVEKTPRSGVTYPSDLNYLRRLYQFNLESIQEYYKTRNFAVKNTHILSRILEHFPVYPQYDSFRYLDFANERTKYLAKHFKFTSELEKGIVHPPHFFGNQGDELILAGYDHFNIQETEVNWKTVSPITILTHNRNDSKLLLPLGNDDKSRSGLSTIHINIPMLSIKYREFMKEQTVRSVTEESLLLNKNHFVTKYVLPTTMRDVIDHIFLNRVMDRFYGREVVTPAFKHRFKIFEPEKQINRYADNVLDVITNKRLDFVNILRNIPLMFNTDASELLALNDIGLTRQMRWSILASRIDYMVFLADVSVKSRDLNRHYLNDWKRLMTRIINDKDHFEMFSYDQHNHIQSQMRRLLEV